MLKENLHRSAGPTITDSRHRLQVTYLLVIHYISYNTARTVNK